MNCSRDSSFSGAVKLGDDESIERNRFLEFASLVEGVASGGGIDDDEGFVRCSFVLLADGAFDLGELVHQVVAGVETPGGVAEEEIVVLVDGALVAW